MLWNIVLNDFQHFARRDNKRLCWEMFEISRDQVSVVRFFCLHDDFIEHGVFGSGNSSFVSLASMNRARLGSSEMISATELFEKLNLARKSTSLYSVKIS